MLCLITSYQGFSQTSSKTNSENCLVPCQALRNALIMKEEKQFLDAKLKMTQDSVRILYEIIGGQNFLIMNKDNEIDLLNENQLSQTKIITEKDKQISEYKKIIRKQKLYKFIGFGTGTLGLAAVVLILL